MRLAEIDLANMTVVQQLGQQLSQEDRVAFTTYVVVHTQAAGYCGLRRDGDGRDPETVGEAIQIMNLRAERMQRVLDQARQSSNAAPTAGVQQANLGVMPDNRLH